MLLNTNMCVVGCVMSANLHTVECVLLVGMLTV